MSTYKKLYFIQPKDHCDSYKPWAREMAQKCICRDCRGMRPEWLGKIPNVYLTTTPRKAVLSTIFRLDINIARIDFLQLFREEVEKYLKLGEVYSGDGKFLDGYVTFTAIRRLVIRGGPKSDYLNVCNICGRYKYLAQYPFSILRAGYFERPIYVPWPESGLVLNETLFSRIDRKKWKGISIFELPILDEPQDGITEIPPDLIIGEEHS